MAEDFVDKIFREAFEVAFLQRLSLEVERFRAFAVQDPRLSDITAAHYMDIIHQFRRFAGGQNRRVW